MHEERRARRVPTLRGWATAVLGVVTAYLLLERSHAEEIGNGSRVGAEFLRGDRPLSPLTWLAFGLLVLILLACGHARVGTPVEAKRGR